MSKMNRNISVSKGHPVRVWVDGCFDLVHFGHANALRQAKSLGTYLVVGVHSDEEITLHKGPPVYTEQERYRLIRAIKWVDEVVEGAPYVTSVKVMDEYSCDFTAHGDDLTFAADGSDPYHEVKTAGRYKEFKRTEGISTTDLVSRILARIKRMQHQKQHAFVDTTEPGSGDGHLRRTRSENSVLSIGLDFFKSSKGLGVQPTNAACGPSDDGKSTDAEDKTLESTLNATWSTCGMPYMPNTLRITQFCMGQYSLDGFREPRVDDVIVYAPGTYDLFHIGHLSFFEKCLEMGTYLLVGLHSDKNASFESQRMGSILTIQERLLSLLACRYVNNVIIDAPYEVPATLLDHFKVDIVAVGMDTKLAPAANGCDPMRIPKERGIFRRVDSGSSVTTTSVISRILQNRIRYEERNRAKEAREARVIATLRSSQTCVGSLSGH